MRNSTVCPSFSGRPLGSIEFLCTHSSMPPSLVMAPIPLCSLKRVNVPRMRAHLSRAEPTLNGAEERRGAEEVSSKWLPLTAVSIERVASSYTVLGRRRNPAMSRSRGWSVPAGLRASVPMQETRVFSWLCRTRTCGSRWRRNTTDAVKNRPEHRRQAASNPVMPHETVVAPSRPTKVHLVNPSDSSFGVAVITPRWLFVLAAATPAAFGDPELCDETLQPLDVSRIHPGDIVGIGIHTANALRGYTIGRMARERGAWVIFGGVHASLYPEEAFEHGGAHAVVRGDGDLAWGTALTDCVNGNLKRTYEGGRIEADQFKAARWDLLSPKRYMWASVQTVRGCPKHCSFCSVWRTDGQRPRQRSTDAVIDEIVQLRRKGFRFIALADDNFYPVSFTDLKLAERQGNQQRLAQLEALRNERFEFMARLADLPADLNFFTQITMEAAEDPQFLMAMRKANIKGALVGVEAVTAEGLKSVYKYFNRSGEDLVERLQRFREHGVYVLGSFIFGLPSDREETFDATLQLAQRSGLAFAQFLMLTPFPGTVDFERWEKAQGEGVQKIAGIPLTR